MLLVIVGSALAQQGRSALRGTVKDELGGLLIGATVTVTDASDQRKTATTNGDGIYVFEGLVGGRYKVSAVATGFAKSVETLIDVPANQRSSLDITLKVTIAEQKVTIDPAAAINTEASNNANQIVVGGKDLDALPDDPNELAAALAALAGPPVGPSGGEIYVDGFSGGTVPPKSSIREIRINQNPFAAENDQPSTRTDIFTKPGTNKSHGGGFFNFNDESFNSRNPFAVSRVAFQIRHFGGDVSGPIIVKKASFFFNGERLETDDNGLVKVIILDSNLNRLDQGFALLVPKRFVNLNPRFDYQLNERNSLVARYSLVESKTKNNGIGFFTLPERGYESRTRSHNIQLIETAIINASMINEARFGYRHGRNENLGDSTKPTLNVSGAFSGGGSQVGHAINISDRWELSDFVIWQKRTHTLKFGGRLLGVHINDVNPSNFGGTYVFTGAPVPQLDANNNPIVGAVPIFADSLERYRRTLLFQRMGFSSAQIRALGGGASQFSISTGNALAAVSQIDGALYAQDDWRIRSNLMFSYGLRYEDQSNIHSLTNLAPRLAFAWSPMAGTSSPPPKTVIRGGAGIFYNRFRESNTLLAHRFNSVTTQQFTVSETPLFVNGQFVQPTSSPLDAFPNLPSLNALTASRQIVWRVDPSLHSPTFFFEALQLERQLPRHTTLTTGAYWMHMAHVIRARDLNQPLPATITATNPDGVRPFGSVGEIYQYESTGSFNQEQISVTVNSRLSKSISFFGSYNWGKSNNNTDGQGSTLFPVNTYDLNGEYGRSIFDIRHQFNFFGTFNLPWWKLSLSPFIIAGTGRPFNITTGQDTNGDGIFSERPSFASAGTNCATPPANVVCTRFGNFNLRPAAGEPLIPRNYGQGPGFFVVNLRINKTWSFGNMPAAPASASTAPGSSGAKSGNQNDNKGASPSSASSKSASKSEPKRYTMQFSISFLNLLNRVNLGTPVGSLSSPFFSQSLSVNQYGGFGPSGSDGAGNRRIFAQLRLSF